MMLGAGGFASALGLLGLAIGGTQISAGVLYNPCSCAARGHLVDLKVVSLICVGALVFHIADIIVVSVSWINSPVRGLWSVLRA